MIEKLKLKIKKAIKYLRFRLSASNNILFLSFYKYFYKPKQGTIAAFLAEYSQSKKGDFDVIQIGANDGITHDPIHKFIKRDQWKGVLLEPQSLVFTQYLSKIYKRDKGIHTLCAAISAEDSSRKIYKIGFSDMRWATGLASFNKENVEKAFSSGLVEKQCKKYNIDLPDPGEYIVSEEIITIKPETLMNQYNISKIDLLQIDVEGFDYEVIRLFDIERFKPKVIIFENSHLSAQDMNSCINLLKKNKYSLLHIGANNIAMQQPLESFSKYFSED